MSSINVDCLPGVIDQSDLQYSITPSSVWQAYTVVSQPPTGIFFSDVARYDSLMLLNSVKWENVPQSNVARILHVDKERSFVTWLSSLTETLQIEDAIIGVLGHVDDLLAESKENECDRLLSMVHIGKTHSDILLALLMATASVPSEQLPFRMSFYDNVRAKFELEVGPQETADILDRLR